MLQEGHQCCSSQTLNTQDFVTLHGRSCTGVHYNAPTCNSTVIWNSVTGHMGLAAGAWSLCQTAASQGPSPSSAPCLARPPSFGLCSVTIFPASWCFAPSCHRLHTPPAQAVGSHKQRKLSKPNQKTTKEFNICGRY